MIFSEIKNMSSLNSTRKRTRTSSRDSICLDKEMNCYLCFEGETETNRFCQHICDCKGSNRIHENCFKELPNQSVCSICRCDFINVNEYKEKRRLTIRNIREKNKLGFLEEYAVDQNGYKQGTYRVYYTNGKIWEEIEYKDNLKNGFQRSWDYFGNLFACIEFKNNREL